MNNDPSLSPPRDGQPESIEVAERVARSVPVHSILDAIGDTPLVALRRLLPRRDIRLWAKLEFANPGGSAKDRPTRRILEQAIRQGQVDSDTLIVESSSGNTGIGLAQVCRYYGLRFRCVVDRRIQPQNLAILKAFGAEIEKIEEPDPETGDFLVARLNRVRAILATTPNAFWADQYGNLEAPRAHEEGTMREIDRALDGRLDYLFVATSSTGTVRGCCDYLRRHGRSTQVVAIDAIGSVLFGGTAGPRKIPGLGAGAVPRLAEDRSYDRVVRVSDLDCVIGCRRLVQRESILAGGSAGGVLEGIRRIARQLSEGARCVAILADGGTRYLDTVYDDDWVERTLGCPPKRLARAVAADSLETALAGPKSPVRSPALAECS